MKGVRIIAYVQIGLAVVFALTAFRVQRSPMVLLDRYADACRDLATVVRMHNTEVYQPIMQNIFTMQEPLKDIGGKVENLSLLMENTGVALQKYRGARWHGIPLYPDTLANLGVSLQTTGVSVGRSGELLVVQSEIIEHYRKGVYDHTVQTLDYVANNLEHTSRELRQFEMPRSPFVGSIVILGVIFLLNGIALLVIAKASGTH